MNVKFTFTDHSSFSKVPFLNPIFQYVDHHLCYLIGPQDISLSTCHNFHQHSDNLCLSGIFMANHTERTQCFPYRVFYQVGILSCYVGHNDFYKLPNFFDFSDFLAAKLCASKWHESTAQLTKNPPFPWPQQINKERMIYIKNKKKSMLATCHLTNEATNWSEIQLFQSWKNLVKDDWFHASTSVCHFYHGVGVFGIWIGIITMEY